jgi:homoserine dehydrogenase
MSLTATIPILTGVVPSVSSATRPLDIALLGLGRVGSAVASLALNLPDSFGVTVQITGALVRDCDRVREDGLHHRVRLTADAADLLARRPDVVIRSWAASTGAHDPPRRPAQDRGHANKSLVSAR